ncbi:MAG: tRNA (adenosine(37)-N6)-threonylcarbamoyltransferase complex ATPase subunit type 1 TsaE [Candidatus Liptonbacteria bacterium]|nr:tRNA (adenosine(37)-N6)-threonylcarbamoyltransferase complex ATPase subunit type 1 TsaE [Candidatus Liptonbacteria bacterium]
MIYKSTSLKEAEKNVAAIARQLVDSRDKALVLGLTGELGSGKTFFVKKFLSFLGVKEKVVSPTFVIMKEYALTNKSNKTNKSDKIYKTNGTYKKAYHVDVYRLEDERSVLRLGLKEIVAENGNIVFIEWAEKIKKLLPRSTIWIKFMHGKRENERILKYAHPSFN